MIAFLKEHGRPTEITAPPSDTHTFSALPPSLPQGFLVPKPEIPPSPVALSEDDYDEARFWRLEDWNKFQAQEKEAGRRPARLEFLTDEQGEVVTQKRKKEFYEYFSVLSASLFAAREDPGTWKKKTKFASEFISNSMRGKFIEFRLCDGDWKLEKYGSIKYSDWDKGPRESGQLRRTSQLSVWPLLIY